MRDGKGIEGVWQVYVTSTGGGMGVGVGGDDSLRRESLVPGMALSEMIFEAPKNIPSVLSSLCHGIFTRASKLNIR